jgi:iron complex outermembrane recepter protein
MKKNHISVGIPPGTWAVSAALVLTTIIPTYAFAQAGDESGQSASLQEVVVTAQRREENLQNVPISVTALGAAQLQKSGVFDMASLPLLDSSLTFGQEAAWAQPHLRGIGTSVTGPGIESSVATYVDGVYYAAMIGGNLDLSEVQDVQIINGPQGTLFGRNATGGVILIKTKDPSQAFGGSASVSYGNYGTSTASAYVTGGLTDTLAANFALDARYQREGYGHNLLTGAETSRTSDVFVRSKWLYTPNNDLTLTFSADYGHVQFTPAVGIPPGEMPLGGGPYVPAFDVFGTDNPGGIINAGSASATLELNLHPVRIVSITAYRITDSFTNEGPLSTTSNPLYFGAITLDEPHRQFSQEVRLVSPAEGIVTWTAGAYYFHETAEYNPTHLWGSLFAPVTDIYYYTRAKTDSYALYGQSTFALGTDTHLTAGFRYTREPRSIYLDNPVLGPGGVNFGPPVSSDSRTFSSPSWRISLDHRFSDQVLGYVSYNRGFKSGGWNVSVLPAVSFNPEKLDAYELGIKTETQDRRLRMNASSFFYNYTDIQVQSFQNAVLLISNGASSHIYGLDLNAEAAVTRGLSLHAGATLMHSRFTSYPNAKLSSEIPGGGTAYGVGSAVGNRLPFAPSAVATVALDYSIPTVVGTFGLNASYAYNKGWYAEPDNRLRQPAYSLVNGQLSWVPKDGAYEIDFFGQNLTNVYYATTMFSQSQGDSIEYAPPRTFGVKLKASF